MIEKPQLVIGGSGVLPEGTQGLNQKEARLMLEKQLEEENRNLVSGLGGADVLKRITELREMLNFASTKK